MNIAKVIIFYLLAAFILSGCSGGDASSGLSIEVNLSDKKTPEQQIQATKEFYGSWMYVETGEEIYLTSTSALLFKKIDNDLIIDDSNRHLVRSSYPETEILGKIFSNTQTAKTTKSVRGSNYTGVGGISVILKNIKDENIQAELITDQNGTFKNNALPSGEYSMVAANGSNHVKENIKLSDRNENLGNYYLLDAAQNNFKTEVHLNSQFMYADGTTYTGSVLFKNISKVDGVGLSFSITTDDACVSDFEFINNLGTIPAGSSKEGVQNSVSARLLNIQHLV